MPRKKKKAPQQVTDTPLSAEDEQGVVSSKRRKLGEPLDGDAQLTFRNGEGLQNPRGSAGLEEDDMQLDSTNRSKTTSNTGATSGAAEKKSRSEEGVPMWMLAARVIDADAQVELSDLEKTSLIDDQLITNLRLMGVEYLFPVQTEVIPFILRGSIIGGDVSVSAPTGSGKTLTYAIPIVQVLSRQVHRRLRALVLVPTRELVVQVYEVFRELSRNTSVKIEALYGDKSFVDEQQKLVHNGESLVDVVISTPGRLVDHIQGTPGFVLCHLRFLVADEADRLLTQSYQDWLPKTLQAVHSVKGSHAGNLVVSSGADALPVIGINVGTSRDTALLSARADHLQFPPLQKLLFSATQTQNPKKLASLKLVSPTYFTAVQRAGHVYKIPATLEQHMIVCRDEEKPLGVLQLLNSWPAGQHILCFTSSVESTHRLALLLQILQQQQQQHDEATNALKAVSIVEYSSSLSQQERDKLMASVKHGHSALIICSDVMSRGLDIQDIGTVLNYDAPTHVKTYVHRAGRTARAGRTGRCYTLVRPEEVWFFKQMLKKAENSAQIPGKLSATTLNALAQLYKDALQRLKIELDREKSKTTLSATETLSKDSVRLRSQSMGDVVAVRQVLLQQLRGNWTELRG